MSDGSLLGLDGSFAPADPVVLARYRDLLERDRPPTEEELGAPTAPVLLPVLVALIPGALARHAREGIPEDVTRAGLQDVGRKHRLYGVETVVSWLVGILRADVVEVGRLQVDRRAGGHGHALHIPETGPLTPASVDDALRRAAGLTGSRRFSCTSWLLDPAIGERLPDSNLAAFAARFLLLQTGDPGDVAASEAACKFVFRRSLDEVLDPALVAPRTRLERLVADRLRSGAQWREPIGVLTP
jgi:hypothetical protein